MICKKIPNGIICFMKMDFNCPHCSKEYDDVDEKYLERMNKNKCGYTRIKCTGCKRVFGMAYGVTGQALAFELYKK